DVPSGWRRLRVGLGRAASRFLASLRELADGGRSDCPRPGSDRGSDRAVGCQRERWSMAELLRIKAELVLSEDAPNPALTRLGAPAACLLGTARRHWRCPAMA